MTHVATFRLRDNRVLIHSNIPPFLIFPRPSLHLLKPKKSLEHFQQRAPCERLHWHNSDNLIIADNRTFGYDKVHPLLLSSAALEIFRPLTHIINLSLKHGIFPDNLKIAKVIPIFKQGSRSSCNNYRTISVLSVLSKIFERCILNQLAFYHTFEDILVPNQYGFRSSKTTVYCLVDLRDEIKKALDEESYAISIFLDLSEAFDTVNHSILLSKLDVYGIRVIKNQWFRSYLTKGKQKVCVNGVESFPEVRTQEYPKGRS